MNEAPPCAAQACAAAARAADARPVLLCLSHLRWDFVFQRPQHLMTRAAATHEVIFLEEPLYQDVAETRLDLSPRAGGVTVAQPILPHGTAPDAAVTAQRDLLDALLETRQGRPLVAWFYTPMALAFAGHLHPDVTVYDCMDELSAFRGAPPAMIEMERRLIARADLVFTGGRSLYEAKRGRHARVHCFPSSIDTAHFGQARLGGEEPEAMRGLKRPRLGFFGVVDERMDIDLLAKLAALRPNWSFVMVGPVVKIDEAALPHAANIHWLGGRGYADLPAHLAHWDVGFMPFALNESTRFISPTKTPEFLAAGLPVVSTPVVDVVRDYGEVGLVEIAEDAAAMAAKVETILARDRAPWLARVDAQLARNSWDITWARMAGLIQDAVAPPALSRSLGGLAFHTIRAAGAAHV